ncbi:hypothetical protein [Bradyrhizobium australiense]|uniref:hypothetical protein n=1 Tax=Bradyrhizobium australiense TaxID=2721161 RepID=UPI0035D80BE4
MYAKSEGRLSWFVTRDASGPNCLSTPFRPGSHIQAEKPELRGSARTKRTAGHNIYSRKHPAVVRIGKRALNNNALRLLVAAAFIGIFLALPFPLIVLGAALLASSLLLVAPRSSRATAATVHPEASTATNRVFSAMNSPSTLVPRLHEHCQFWPFGLPFG